MASQVYYSPFIPAFSSNGAPVPGAKIYFFYTGTNTKAPVYLDSGMSTPSSNPVQADLAGRFPNLYVDDSITYRVRLTTSTGAPIGSDIDPYAPGQALKGDQGVPGPAGPTYLTLADFKAAPIENEKQALKANGIADGDFYWTLGDYSGTLSDDLNVNIIKADSTALSVGAWVRQDAAGVAFVQPQANARIRATRDKLRDTVSVLDFGAIGDGVTDDTAAFNRAIATGKTVFVPKRTYLVDGITVVSNMQIVGEKSGECLGPEFVVANDDGCVFFQPSATFDNIVTHCVFENFAMRAGTGVTGARGFYSEDKTHYTASVTFRNIETHRDLLWGYDGLFIFTDWINCRDGYLPGIGVFTSDHGFIKSDAAVYGQINATNTNNVIRCKIFRGYGVEGSVQISYGDTWTFTGCRWENMDSPAVRAFSVRKLVLDYPRAEGSRLPVFAVLQEMPGSGVGSTATIRDGLFAVDTEDWVFVSIDALSRAGVEDCEFGIINTGSTLTDLPGALTLNRNNTVSGVGSANFMTGTFADRQISGRKTINGAVDNGVANMTFQNEGGVSATKGFLTQSGLTVGTSFVTIATSQTGFGGLVRVSGQVATGPFAGAQFSNLIDFQGTDIIQVYTARPVFGATATFQVAGNDLQMKVDTNSVMVTTTLIH